MTQKDENNSQNLNDDLEPVRITSNNLCDYAVGSLLVPEDKNGNSFPFTFEVKGLDSIYVKFTEVDRRKFWEGNINYALYQQLLTALIEKRSKEVGDITFTDKDDDGDYFTLIYSAILQSSTLDEAVAKSVMLMEELHSPLNQAMNEVEEFLKKELKLV